MLKSKMRLLAVSALVGAGIVATGPSDAANLRIGGVDVQIDTILSAGASWRVEDRETDLLPSVNGGPADLSPGLELSASTFTDANGNVDTYLNADLTVKNTVDAMTALGRSGAACGVKALAIAGGNDASCQFDTNDANYNYDTGLNGDDGRLNFDSGDITSGNLKFTTDIQADFSADLRGFVRFQGFYDAVLDDDGSFERNGLTEQADRKVIENINVLDAYLDFSGEVANSPFNVRVGRQVVNWGESTFFLGGNSVQAPIDVPAIQRPGAEIKDALLPVEAIYGSIALPYDITVEAYVSEWDHFRLPVGGTALATSDAASLGSITAPHFFVGTGNLGGNRRNCDAANSTAVGVAHALAANNTSTTADLGADLDTLLGPCTSADVESHVNTLEQGQAELQRLSINYTNAATGNSLGDRDFMSHGGDIVNDDFDDIGLAIRWYSEALNSTEFGLYYQKYTSRIPYISSRANAPILSHGTIGPDSGAFLRQYGIAGCMTQKMDDTSLAADPYGTVAFEDPLGLASVFSAAVTDANLIAFGQGLEGALDPQGVNQDHIDDNVAKGLSSSDGVVEANPTTLADLAEISCALTMSQAQMSGIAAAHAAHCASFGDNSNFDASAAAQIGCSAGTPNSFDGSTKIGSAFAAAGGLYLPTGAITPALRYGGSIFLEYPDDIEVVGLSFATTVLGWGVQGEVAYREEMPLQHDTDMVTISAIAGSCAWENFTGVKGLLYGQQLTPTRCGDYDLYQGYSLEEVVHWDIGTTATFTRSNPVVNFLGADIAILLTEFQTIHVPGAEDYAVDLTANKADSVSNTVEVLTNVATKGAPRLATKCTSGSDLPLGGVLSLDPRTVDECRPTVDSSGALLYFQLQYNNVFGTPYSLSPTLVYRTGLDGMSPSPAGGWIEDQSVTGLSITAKKQGGIEARLGYTMYDGDVLYNQMIDRDQVSLSVNYAF